MVSWHLCSPSKSTFILSRMGGKRCVLCVFAHDCMCVLCVCMCVYVYVCYVCMWEIQLQNLGTFSIVHGSGMCMLCVCVCVVCMCYVCVGIRLRNRGPFSQPWLRCLSQAPSASSPLCFAHTCVPPGFVELSSCNWTEGLSSVMDAAFFPVPVFWTVEGFTAGLVKGFDAFGVMKHFIGKDNWVFSFTREKWRHPGFGDKVWKNSIKDQDSERPCNYENYIETKAEKQDRGSAHEFPLFYWILLRTVKQSRAL